MSTTRNIIERLRAYTVTERHYGEAVMGAQPAPAVRRPMVEKTPRPFLIDVRTREEDCA